MRHQEDGGRRLVNMPQSGTTIRLEQNGLTVSSTTSAIKSQKRLTKAGLRRTPVELRLMAIVAQWLIDQIDDAASDTDMEADPPEPDDDLEADLDT